MKPARWVAVLAGLGLLLTLALPALTGGRASSDEVAPFLWWLLALFLVACALAIGGGRRWQLVVSIVIGLVALVATVVAVGMWGAVENAQADLEKSIADIEDERRHAMADDGALDPSEVNRIEELQRRANKFAHVRDVASPTAAAWAAVVATLYVGLCLAVLRYRRGRKLEGTATAA